MRCRRFLLPLLVMLVAAVAHLPAVGHDFVLWDDPVQVYENQFVQEGLTARSIQRALTDTRATLYWMPVTYLSHMLDVELFGLAPWGHHLTNILLHSVNAGLLWLLLFRLTGSMWRSAVAALLFAVHPAHVESVAWVTERKDVLSLAFGLLSLVSYERYARTGGMWWYAGAAGALATGLMAKAMIVTLPCVMLLLDYWPLRRLMATWRSMGVRVMEKAPLLALCIAAAVLTSWTQQDAMPLEGAAPLADRLANAVVSYARYLGMLAWPVDLSPFYPFRGAPPAWQVAGAGALLAALTLGTATQWRRRPFITVGWFWYAGTFVPMIGLVQVGGQALAARFTYLPFIGLYIAVVWLSAEWVDRLAALRLRRGVAAAGVAALVLSLATGSWAQSRHWADTETLFRHALRVEPSGIAHIQVGGALARRGRLEEASAHFQQALLLQPDSAIVRRSVAAHLSEVGREEEAVVHLREALRFLPNNRDTQVMLANVLIKLGRDDEAFPLIEAALRSYSGDADAMHAMGLWLSRAGRLAEALQWYRDAVQAAPFEVGFRTNYALALQRAGRVEQAMAHFARVAELKPGVAAHWFNLAAAEEAAGRFTAAVEHYGRAIALRPDDAAAHNNLGVALAQMGRIDEALPHFERAAALGHEDAAANAARARSLLQAPSARD